MKTKNPFKQYFPVLFFMLVLIAPSIEAGAQNRRDSDRWKKHEKAEYRNAERKADQHATAEYDRKPASHYQLDHHNYSGHEDRRFAERHEHSVYDAHPQYGRVYRHFEGRPVVLRNNHRDYYYDGNRFYTFRPGIGYCAVDFPQNVYFERLPFACEQVYVNGIRYYRHNDLYFRLFGGGYQVVPSPFRITISARF
jgi:hypothetical protein